MLLASKLKEENDNSNRVSPDRKSTFSLGRSSDYKKSSQHGSNSNSFSIGR